VSNNVTPMSHSLDEAEKALAAERETPHETLLELLKSYPDTPELEATIAMNLSQRTSVYDRTQGAHPLMETLLALLAKSSDMSARWAVAKNPHTSVTTLEFLAKDSVNLVRALVASNPATPFSLLEGFFHDEKIVRDGLTGNPSTPTKYLNILADDSDRHVRIRVAENPSTPESTLKKLENDSDTDVSKAATHALKERHGNA